ncbi:MAG: hypothetical protein CYPHOPRED_003966 [Cyphobasidiales sp. Tagirdzhanova-0007]|nr:MAG: hypothetical protein CYPHOPRED_003966 [Cyphobasidiales sp. Tagirdzhanova-0007]
MEQSSRLHNRTHIKLDKEIVREVASNKFPGYWPFDNQGRDAAKFHERLQVNIGRLSHSEIEVDIIGIDTSIANAIRRVLLAEVPTVAVENVYIWNNTSLVQDEVLSQRLGLVPLRIDPHKVEFKLAGDEPTDLNTIVFSMVVKCEQVGTANKDERDPEKLYTNAHIHSSAFTWQPKGVQNEAFANDPPRPVYEDILLAKLRPNQEILLEMHCEKGIGKDHAKWSPVATASYRLLPTIVLTQPIESPLCQKFASCFPPGVVEVAAGADGRDEVRIANVRKDTGCDRTTLSLSSRCCELQKANFLDRLSHLIQVKTRIQLQGGRSSTTGVYYEGMVDCFKKIIAQEGFSRLYRGLVPPLMLEAPKRAVKFAANDRWGQIYRNAFQIQKPTQGLSVLTGCSAGATESIVVVPFELIKIRLQDRNSAGKYKGALDCLAQVVRQEGVLGLYNGLEPTFWRHVTWNGGYFGCIFQVRSWLPKPATKSVELRNNLISGTIGGFVGTALNTPFDVIKSRVQNSPKVSVARIGLVAIGLYVGATMQLRGSIPKYNWTIPSLFMIAREEGVAALYKGFLPKVLRLAPGGGVLLLVVEFTLSVFRKQLGPPYLEV